MAKQSHATADADELDDRPSAAAGGRGSAAARKKDRRSSMNAHWLLQTGLYKRNQGRITRQVTFGSLMFVAAYGCWRLNAELISATRMVQIGVPLVLFGLVAWVAYRLVNMPQFADFLIAVEAEMAKVSWPTRSELINSSIVVIVVIMGMAALLFGYDTFWNFLLSTILHVK